MRGPGRYDVRGPDANDTRVGGGWERVADGSREYGLPTLRQQLRQWNRHDVRHYYTLTPTNPMQASEHGPGTYGVVEAPASEAFDGRYLDARGPRMAPENK